MPPASSQYLTKNELTDWGKLHLNPKRVSELTRVQMSLSSTKSSPQPFKTQTSQPIPSALSTEPTKMYSRIMGLRRSGIVLSYAFCSGCASNSAPIRRCTSRSRRSSASTASKSRLATQRILAMMTATTPYTRSYRRHRQRTTYNSRDVRDALPWTTCKSSERMNRADR